MNLYGVVANVLDCDIIISEFELQSIHYVLFRTKYLRERYELSYPLQLGVK